MARQENASDEKTQETEVRGLVRRLLGTTQYTHNLINIEYCSNPDITYLDNNPLLLLKIAGERASEFEVAVTPSHRGSGGRLLASLVSTAGGGVRVEASSGVGVAWALHHYLKYHARCHVSWQTSQLSLPAQLPHVNKTLEAVDLFR